MRQRVLGLLGGLGGVLAVRSYMASSQPWSSDKDAASILEEPRWPEQFPLTSQHLSRVDSSSDGVFYSQPRFVHHIDEHAIGALKTYYGRTLPQGGTVVDLMSSWTSHVSSGLNLSRPR